MAFYCPRCKGFQPAAGVCDNPKCKFRGTICGTCGRCQACGRQS